MIFGRTDLRIGQSEAKFDAEADFDVRSAVAPQKPVQFDEKPISRSKTFLDVFWLPKMKCCKSSETRFAKVSRRYQLCSGGKLPFEVSKKNRNSRVYRN